MAWLVKVAFIFSVNLGVVAFSHSYYSATPPYKTCSGFPTPILFHPHSSLLLFPLHLFFFFFSSDQLLVWCKIPTNNICGSLWVTKIDEVLPKAFKPSGWSELFLVLAVRYSPCRSRLAMYLVANIDLWYMYIFRDRNWPFSTKMRSCRLGRVKLLVTSHSLQLNKIFPGNDLYFDGWPYQGHQQRSICPRAPKVMWYCPPCCSVVAYV